MLARYFLACLLTVWAQGNCLLATSGLSALLMQNQKEVSSVWLSNRYTDPMLVECSAVIVYDAGPALKQHCVSVSGYW